MLERWKKLLEAVLDDITTGSNITSPVDDSNLETVKTEEEKPAEKEQDVTKLDLTVPEHLKTFKNSYEKKSYELEQSSTRVAELEHELDSIRENQGKGIFLDTNVPLDEFDPDTILARMAEEEPEYHERIIGSLMKTHFWPNVSGEFKSLETRQLNESDENDKIILDQMIDAANVMSQRTFGITYPVLYGIMDTLVKSPDIKEELMARMNGQSTYRPDAPFTSQRNPASPTGRENGQVESVEQIAKRLNLDPSEEVHMSIIQGIQADQRTKITTPQNSPNSQPNPQLTQMQQAYDNQMRQMQQTIDQLKNEKQKATTMSDEELVQKAESRLTTMSNSALENDIRSLYGNAVPKDKPNLLSTLKTVVEVELNKDPNYTKAQKTAKSWFKQAAGAKTASDRDRWDQKGIDALAVMVPIRVKKIHEKATELIGTTKTRVDERRKAPTTRPKELTDTSRIVPPRSEVKPAATGDITAAKEAIRERVRRSFPNLS
jgi:hypothetical protein